ncbi:MAG: sigma-70 family RNA polymerase sigma factor [Myxococcales bacterium]|nr:sigma-70 family RNA polymerase sigma factor [Myxococcales bacterium]
MTAVVERRADAWNRFYKRYERLIVACIRKVLSRYGVPSRPEDIEDLVNTVCLQLIRDDYAKLRKFDAERGYRLSSWVGLIATNAAHDALRRRGPPTYSIDDEESGFSDRPAHQPTPAEVTLLREQEDALNRAVQSLSPAEQQFLRYYYLEQRQPDEIAELLNISINTVYSRKNKVRANLKKIIERMESSKRPAVGDRSA